MKYGLLFLLTTILLSNFIYSVDTATIGVMTGAAAIAASRNGGFDLGKALSCYPYSKCYYEELNQINKTISNTDSGKTIVSLYQSTTFIFVSIVGLGFLFAIIRIIFPNWLRF